MTTSTASDDEADTADAMAIGSEQRDFVDHRRRLLGRAMLPPHQQPDFQAFLDHIQREWDHWNRRADSLVARSVDGKDRWRTQSQLLAATRELSESCATLGMLNDMVLTLSGGEDALVARAAPLEPPIAPPLARQATVSPTAAKVVGRNDGPAPDDLLLDNAKQREEERQAWMKLELVRRQQVHDDFHRTQRAKNIKFFKSHEEWRKTFKF